mgnify:CR=1 FL=1
MKKLNFRHKNIHIHDKFDLSILESVSRWHRFALIESLKIMISPLKSMCYLGAKVESENK